MMAQALFWGADAGAVDDAGTSPQFGVVQGAGAVLGRWRRCLLFGAGDGVGEKACSLGACAGAILGC